MPRGYAKTGFRKIVRYEATCVQCKGSFMAAHKDTQYCSMKCRDKHKYIPSIHPRIGKYIPCDYCGKDVWKRNSRQQLYKKTFCNQEHMVAYMQERAHRLNCVVCGSEFFCQPCQVEYRSRKTCSKECAGVLLTRYAAERLLNNPPTVGVLNRRIRYSKRMMEWRKSVFERDNYTCQGCGKRGGYLEADHIKPFALFPELRFELSNGRTMCRPCHQRTETWGNRRKSRAKEETISQVSKA